MSTSKYLQTMYIALFNATVVTILTFAVTSPFAFWRGIKCDADNLPPLNQIIYETLACILVIEPSFYYLHRLVNLTSKVLLDYFTNIISIQRYCSV